MNSAAPIKISATMLRDHLSIITVGWFDDRNLPPPTVEAYADQLADLRDVVTESGDLPWFVLGLQHILDDPAISPRSFVNTRFAYSDDEAREIMHYVLRELAPKRADPAPPVILEEMPWHVWKSQRPLSGLVPDV